jgi:hypothetical protein
MTGMPGLSGKVPARLSKRSFVRATYDASFTYFGRKACTRTGARISQQKSKAEPMRMAHRFDGLYSRERGPRDSAGWTEKDDCAEMGQNLDFASATNCVAAFDPDEGGLAPTASEPQRERARAQPPSARQKTNIEMAIERRQQLEAIGRSGFTGSNKSEPTPRTAAADSAADQTPVSFAPEAEPRRREEAAGVESGLACGPADAPAAGSRFVDNSAPEADANRSQLHPVRGSRWSDRSSSAKKLAAAVIVLLIGTSIGYMAGKGFEPIGVRTIGSSGNGLKLRLDSDLRQR